MYLGCDEGPNAEKRGCTSRPASRELRPRTKRIELYLVRREPYVQPATNHESRVKGREWASSEHRARKRIRKRPWGTVQIMYLGIVCRRYVGREEPQRKVSPHCFPTPFLHRFHTVSPTPFPHAVSTHHFLAVSILRSSVLCWCFLRSFLMR